MNLMPSDADEAIALIPSMIRFSPIDVASVLDVLNSFMKPGGVIASSMSQIDSAMGAPLPY